MDCIFATKIQTAQGKINKKRHEDSTIPTTKTPCRVLTLLNDIQRFIHNSPIASSLSFTVDNDNQRGALLEAPDDNL
jgi:hypothetical protein